MNSPFEIRLPREKDETALSTAERERALPGWWTTDCPHLTLVAEQAGKTVAELRVADRSYPKPTMREGDCELRLVVAAAFRRQRIGAALFHRALDFANAQCCRRLTATYFEGDPGDAGKRFLLSRSFVPFETYRPAHLDLDSFDPVEWSGAIERLRAQEVQITTLAELGDSPILRQQLYELECRARSTQPFRKQGDYVPISPHSWAAAMESKSSDTVFIAYSATAGRPVGVVSGLSGAFTGVDPAWRGRGIATGLKVYALTRAKEIGLRRVETENHEDNAPMLAINRKLGYVADPVEVNCLLRID